MEKKRKKVTTESKLLIMLARNNIRKNGGDSDQNSDFKQTVKLHVKDFPQLMN